MNDTISQYEYGIIDRYRKANNKSKYLRSVSKEIGVSTIELADMLLRHNEINALQYRMYKIHSQKQS